MTIVTAEEAARLAGEAIAEGRGLVIVPDGDGFDVADLGDVTEGVREALEGDSNDAEHDALVCIADALRVRYADTTYED
jgi:hypothetical protein